MVSGELVLNRGSPDWWSFHDIDASDVGGCGELAGPLAIVVSEETPRKFFFSIGKKKCDHFYLYI